MHTPKILWACVALLFTVIGCKRETPTSTESDDASAIAINAKDLVAPAGFNFETEKDLNVRVKVADAIAGEKYAIKIYSDLPATGKLISTGITNSSAEYTTTVRVPASTEYIYIEKVDQNGNSKYEKVKANLFNATVFNNSGTATPYILRKTSGMDCSTGCTVTYNNPTTSITVNNGEVACITGTISSAIDLNINAGGIAKICANGSFAYVSIYDGGKLYILENTILTMSTVYAWGNLYNYSDSLKTLVDFDFFTGTGVNHGKIYCESGVKVLGNVTFTNNGYMKSDSRPLFAWGQNAKFINNSSIEVHGFYITLGGEIVNNCKLISNFVSENNNILTNNAYIKVNAKYISRNDNNNNIDPVTKLNNGSLMSINELDFQDGEIEGTGGTRSKLKVANTSTLLAGTEIKGAMDLCDADGIETNNGTVSSPALVSCAGFIPTSTCNPEGFGSVSTQDSDNDGVADSQDEYPNDITRAFNSYYPDATTMATIAFEDLWPSQGDYDYNDLSVLVNIQTVYNVDNEVVDYKVKLKVKSIGGTFVNGFGFQLDDVLPSEVSSITGQVLTQNLITRSGNNTEAAQDKAVIICYDSPEPIIQRATGSMFNTVKTNGMGTSDTVHITINLNTPMANTKFTIDKFNPFIFTNQRRAYEVHLGNFAPTSLANASLLGTNVDRSNPSQNIYYKNKNGMPWAIIIPGEFNHPKEKSSITSAYNFFDDWVSSSGSTFPNWYSDAVGYRNTQEIY